MLENNKFLLSISLLLFSLVVVTRGVLGGKRGRRGIA
jgi:hypothetical protein